jgi:hypothetical protein
MIKVLFVVHGNASLEFATQKPTKKQYIEQIGDIVSSIVFAQ